MPEDWEVVRLGEIGKIIGGGTPSTKKKEFWKGAIPWISSSDIDENDVFNISQTRYITQDAIDKSSTKSIEPNSILVVSRVGIGKVAINQNVLCTSQDIQALTQHNQDAFFLVYAIKNLVSLVCRINQGTSIKGFTKEVLSNLQVPLPPLAEQEKIASVLSTWDRQIQNLQSLITEKQNLKKGLAQTLLSAKIRFKGFSEEWQVVRLGEVCEMKKGEQLNKIILDEVEGYPVINGGILPSGFTSAYNTFPNTITISEGGNSCGFVNYIQEYFWSGGHCYTLQNLKILDMFLFQVLKHNEKKIQMLRVGSGLPNIQKRDLEKFSISIPSKIEQEKIAEILSEADNEITLLEQKLQSLEIQKKGLMQILLSGKVRVKWN